MKPKKRSSLDQLILKNAQIITQDSKRRMIQGHVLIQDGVIEKISKSLSSKISRNTRVIDLSGKTLLPGLIQTHVHLCQTLFRNQADDLQLMDWLKKKIWPLEGAHTDETMALSADIGLHELLSTGTTCLLDMGSVRHTDALIDSIQSSGIRANVGKCLMDHPTLTPPYLRESTDDALRETHHWLEKFKNQTNSRIRYSLAPRFALSCTETLLREVSKLSASFGGIIHTHGSENQSEISLVKRLFGSQNIEYLDRMGLATSQLVLAHGVWLSKKERRILASSNSSVTHCPSSNLKLASGIADIVELQKSKINVSLGADGAPCNNNLNLFTEMRLAALLQKPGHGPHAVRAQEALDMATLNGAKSLHWSDEIGSIEVGKKADLICLDLDRPECWPNDHKTLISAVVYSSGPQNLEFTMVDGKMLYQNGTVKSISFDGLRRRLERLWPKHQNRANQLNLNA